MRGTYQPYVGDYGGDGPDVLWYAGDPNDILWFGHADRRFTSRETTIDIGYTRAPPLRPEALGTQYDPFGFVAHAFGAIDGHAYSNWRAFQRNYGAASGSSRSTWSAWPTAPPWPPTPAWRPTTASASRSRGDLGRPGRHRYLDRYTVLRPGPGRLLREHPDAYFILDSKWSRLEIYRTILRQAPERSVRERLLPHVEDRAEPRLRTAYRSRTTWSPCTTPRPRTGTTTRWRSTSPAATGPRP